MIPQRSDQTFVTQQADHETNYGHQKSVPPVSLSSQDDQRLPQEVRPAVLQGGGADEGRVGVSGPVRGQIPGPSREAGTQADGALCPGRGNDEEGGHGQRLRDAQRRAASDVGAGGRVGGRGWNIKTEWVKM